VTLAAAGPARRRVIRAPNHLGDVIMALPAIAADGADVVVRRWLAPVLGMAGLDGRIFALDPGFPGWARMVRTLRAGRFRHGVLLAPSFSAAWLFAWGGVRSVRGTATDGRAWLLAEPLPREVLRGRHRINQFKLLLEQDPGGPPRSHPLTPPASLVEQWRDRLGVGGAPLVGIFPGSNAPARRWPPERFGAVAKGLGGRGARVVILGGAGERDITRRVAASAPGAMDLGGGTDLPGLAALLSICRLVVTNDTGPMHLAGAVGTPTVTLWGPSDPGEVCPVGARDERVTGDALPCKPCFKNRCPRSGEGTLLPQAHEECMRLIREDRVLEIAQSVLTGGAR
jgi:ADP-heptose:LPS heptosyltransferase